jgi:phage tail-like protein
MTLGGGISLRDVLGLNNRFGVIVDGIDLGMWGSCKGLGVEFKPDKIVQGGVYDYEVILPGQMSYKTITLKRALNAQDSMKVQGWLSKMVNDWVYAAGEGSAGAAVITLFDSKGAQVISWTLRNVYPSKWDGPDLDATTFGIAMETLDLQHEGFL